MTTFGTKDSGIYSSGLVTLLRVTGFSFYTAKNSLNTSSFRMWSFILLAAANQQKRYSGTVIAFQLEKPISQSSRLAHRTKTWLSLTTEIRKHNLSTTITVFQNWLRTHITHTVLDSEVHSSSVLLTFGTLGVHRTANSTSNTNTNPTPTTKQSTLFHKLINTRLFQSNNL